MVVCFHIPPLMIGAVRFRIFPQIPTHLQDEQEANFISGVRERVATCVRVPEAGFLLGAALCKRPAFRGRDPMHVARKIIDFR